MLQLPPAQLTALLESSPALREPLLEHVQGFTEAQRAHVSKSIMEVLYAKDVDRVMSARAKAEGDTAADEGAAAAEAESPVADAVEAGE